MTKKTKTDTPATKPPENKGWQTAGQSDAWRPEKKGDSITGIYVDKFEFTSKTYHNESTGYRIRTPEGMKTVFGTGRLDRKMGEIPKNAEVIITYLGKVKDKNVTQDVHEWKVDYRIIGADVPF